MCKKLYVVLHSILLIIIIICTLRPRVQATSIAEAKLKVNLNGGEGWRDGREGEGDWL